MRSNSRFSSTIAATRLAPAVVGVVALATSAVAIAGGVGSDLAVVDKRSPGTAIATCTRGGVVAGGFDTPGFGGGPGESSVARLSSVRVGKRQVRTDAYNFGSQAGQIVSLAYCSKLGKKVKVKSASEAVPPNGSATVTANCGRRKVAVGGGFEAPGFSAKDGPRIVAMTSRREGKRQWLVEGLNTPGDPGASDAAGTLVAYAYCRKRGPKLATRSAQTPVPGDGTATVEAACPGKRKALSGGFDGNLQVGDTISVGAAIASKRAPGGKAWSITAISGPDPTTGTATAFAYCTRKKR